MLNLWIFVKPMAPKSSQILYYLDETSGNYVEIDLQKLITKTIQQSISLKIGSAIYNFLLISNLLVKFLFTSLRTLTSNMESEAS